MKKKPLVSTKLLCFISTSIMIHLAQAQEPLPESEAQAEAPLLALPPSTNPALSENTVPRRMLHHWSHVTSLSNNQKNLQDMMAEHPELQTHSHMTYYSSPILVGERTRLQPPGSEFKH